MKKIIVLGALVMGTFAFAQEAPKEKGFDGERKEEMKAKIQEKLNLNEEQKRQADLIDQKYAGEEESLKKQFEALCEKREELHKRKREELERILTPEQKEKLTEMKDNHQKMKEKHQKAKEEGKGKGKAQEKTKGKGKK